MTVHVYFSYEWSKMYSMYCLLFSARLCCNIDSLRLVQILCSNTVVGFIQHSLWLVYPVGNNVAEPIFITTN